MPAQWLLTGLHKVFALMAPLWIPIYLVLRAYLPIARPHFLGYLILRVVAKQFLPGPAAIYF